MRDQNEAVRGMLLATARALKSSLRAKTGGKKPEIRPNNDPGGKSTSSSTAARGPTVVDVVGVRAVGQGLRQNMEAQRAVLNAGSLTFPCIRRGQHQHSSPQTAKSKYYNRKQGRIRRATKIVTGRVASVVAKVVHVCLHHRAVALRRVAEPPIAIIHPTLRPTVRTHTASRRIYGGGFCLR